MSRRVLPPIFAIAVLVLSASPVFAGGWIQFRSWGSRGWFDYWEGPPVVCRYDATSNVMTSITVKPPKIWGTHNPATFVGWRFKVEFVYPHRHSVYTSPVYKTTASVDTPSAFRNQRLSLSHDLASTSDDVYYVKYILYWYEPGSKTIREGLWAGSPMEYLRRFGTQTKTSIGCFYRDWQREAV